VEEAHRMDLAVLGSQERGRELLRAFAGERVRERDLVHRKTVGPHERQRGTQILGLVLGPRESQAAVGAIVAVDAEALDELTDATVGAASDFEHGASPGTAP